MLSVANLNPIFKNSQCLAQEIDFSFVVSPASSKIAHWILNAGLFLLVLTLPIMRLQWKMSHCHASV